MISHFLSQKGQSIGIVNIEKHTKDKEKIRSSSSYIYIYITKTYSRYIRYGDKKSKSMIITNNK